jgi:hypothetical protein
MNETVKEAKEILLHPELRPCGAGMRMKPCSQRDAQHHLPGSFVMYTLLLGFIVLAATALVFRLALPVGGKVRPWITDTLEPIVTVAIVGGLGISIILMITGTVSLMGQP